MAVDAPPRPPHGWVSLIPGCLGATLVCVGLAWIWAPLGLVAAGAFLLLLDHRL